jgi:hypothetical protein
MLKIFCLLDQHKLENVHTDLRLINISEYDKIQTDLKQINIAFSLPPDLMIEVPDTHVNVSLCKHAQI